MSKLPIGTFVNMTSIVIGSIIGLMLREVFPENIKDITFVAVGLSILIIGIRMSIKVPEEYLLIFIFSLVLGGILGELLGVEEFLDWCEGWINNNFRLGKVRFTEGLITAFVLFCASSLTIVGAIEEGMQGKRELLLVKSALDGVTAIALASSYGIGVLVSIVPMLIIQGGMTMLAVKAKPLFNKSAIALISGVGGVLIVAISIKILELGEFRVANLLPSLIVVVFLYWGFNRLHIKV
jgi:uncharacterized membrane protein YqgA involved in biofilm formation